MRENMLAFTQAIVLGAIGLTLIIVPLYVVEHFVSKLW
jgi:hypothetical protein